MNAQLRIIPGENASEDDVFHLLQHSFFLDEPMNASLNLMPNKEEFQPLTHLYSGYSLAAYVKSNDGQERLAGVVLNKERKRDEDNVIKARNETVQILINFLKKLEEETDIWSRISTDKLFYTMILSVGKEFRGLKIAERLMEESLKKAKESGFTHAAVKCTSAYSAKIMEKFNYDRIGEIRYDNYRDDSGKILMKVEKPHEAAVKYLKKL